MLETLGSTTGAKPMPYRRACRLAAARAEFGEPAIRDCAFDGARIIAGIQQAAARGLERKSLGGNEVAADDLDRVERKLDRDPPHEALERIIHLRAAEA